MLEFTSYKWMEEGTQDFLVVLSWNRISATWISKESMSNGHSLSFSGRNQHLNKKLGEERILPSWLHLPEVELLPHWAEGEKGAKTKIAYIFCNLFNHIQEWSPEFPNYKSKPYYCTKIEYIYNMPPVIFTMINIVTFIEHLQCVKHSAKFSYVSIFT